MQRLHLDDPAARAIADGAEHVVLPMRYDPEHPLPTIAANTSSLNEIVPTPHRVGLTNRIIGVRRACACSAG